MTGGRDLIKEWGPKGDLRPKENPFELVRVFGLRVTNLAFGGRHG